MDFFNIIQVGLFFYIIGKEIIERCGVGWDTEEDKQLTMLYSKYKMELTEIAEIHKRSVSVIQSRLEKLGVFNHTVHFKLNDIFFMVRNSTLCIDETRRKQVMNDLCNTIEEQWAITRQTLADHMEDYGFEYTIPCYECGQELPWDFEGLCTNCGHHKKD
jgi:hypothetical protein